MVRLFTKKLTSRKIFQVALKGFIEDDNVEKIAPDSQMASSYVISTDALSISIAFFIGNMVIYVFYTKLQKKTAGKSFPTTTLFYQSLLRQIIRSTSI